MAELTEKDPQLARVIDPRTSRNLLEDPRPLEAVPESAEALTLTVRVENGPEAPIALTITSDQDWLAPQRPGLSLMGGEAAEFRVTVRDGGKAEFANLCFAWEAAGETQREYVLVWRKLPEGVWPKPAWMT